MVQSVKFSFTDGTLCPPPFNRKLDVYVKWKQKFNIWQSITDVTATKQGGLLVLQLDDDTQEAVLDSFTNDDIKSDGGVQKILDYLDVLFEVDTSLAAYEAYMEFQNYQRPPNISIDEYCWQFQRRLVKIQRCGTSLADSILAYKLLTCANLSVYEEQLIKATTDVITYESISKQLKKVFNHAVPEISPSSSKFIYKEELCSGYNNQKEVCNMLPATLQQSLDIKEITLLEDSNIKVSKCTQTIHSKIDRNIVAEFRCSRCSLLKKSKKSSVVMKRLVHAKGRRVHHPNSSKPSKNEVINDSMCWKWLHCFKEVSSPVTARQYSSGKHKDVLHEVETKTIPRPEPAKKRRKEKKRALRHKVSQIPTRTKSRKKRRIRVEKRRRVRYKILQLRNVRSKPCQKRRKVKKKRVRYKWTESSARSWKRWKKRKKV
jgi:hypothetical protein